MPSRPAHPAPGATGAAVRRLQRALRRTPNLSLAVDGVFGPATEARFKQFQGGAGLTADGVVGPLTWQALPDARPDAHVERRLARKPHRRPSARAVGRRSGPVEHRAGSHRRKLRPAHPRVVVAFQHWGHVGADGVVGDQTWAVSLHAASATLESEVGLQFVIG